MMLLKPQATTIPWYRYLTPHTGRFIYVCETQDLHEVRMVYWGKRVLFSRDRVIVSVPLLLSRLGVARGASSDDTVQDEMGLALQ